MTPIPTIAQIGEVSTVKRIWALVPCAEASTLSAEAETVTT